MTNIVHTRADDLPDHSPVPFTPRVLPEPWPAPDPLLLRRSRRPPVPFPDKVLAPEWDRWIRDTAMAAGAPPDYVAMPLLSALAALVGNARVVSPWEGWKEPSILWTGIVGDPSAGKSPGSDPVLSLVRAIERERAECFDETYRHWQTLVASAEIIKETWNGELRSALRSGEQAPTMPSGAIAPPEPERPRIITSDATTKQGSTLTGESTVRTLQAQLRGLFNTPLSSAGGGLTSLSDVGIAFQTDGTLNVDATKLSKALNDPTKDVASLFAAVAKPTDSLVSFGSSTAETKNGLYALNVTQIATQGKAVGGAAAALTVTGGANDTLDLEIDGIGASITIAAGTYTADALAAEIQSKVNGVAALSSAGATVSVTQSGGVLSITSNRYGSASTVALTGGNARADLFGTQVETDGLDVAGTIGGFAATGAGQTLTGFGDAAGLKLTVTGGAIGDRGTVSYARGYADQLDKLISRMLDDDSLIEGRLKGIGSSIDDIGDRREAMALRLESTEKRLRAQFTALDTLMSRMQQTSSFLSQQLANLPTYE